MYRLNPKDVVKVDRYTLLTWAPIGISRQSSIYLLVPLDFLKELRKNNIDLKNDPKLQIVGNLVVEDDGLEKTVKVVYSFRHIPQKVLGEQKPERR